jgi:hypothetical protein
MHGSELYDIYSRNAQYLQWKEKQRAILFIIPK